MPSYFSSAAWTRPDSTHRRALRLDGADEDGHFPRLPRSWRGRGLRASRGAAILAAVAESRRSLPLRFDPFRLADVVSPYPVFAELRDAGPLCRGGAGQWL